MMAEAHKHPVPMSASPSSVTLLPPKAVLKALAWAREVGEEGFEKATTRPELPIAQDFHRLTSEQMRTYVDALLCGRFADEGLQALLDIGFLEMWLPEVSAMVGFGDGEWRHKDVWKHTKQVVKQAVPRLSVRWGALLHDIGKIKTRSVDARGEVHFIGHSEVGARMFRKKVGARLGLEGELFDRVHFLILQHLRPGQYDGSWTDSAVRRFARDMGDGLRDLLDLGRADITTKRPEKRKRGLRHISALAARIRKLEEEDAKVPPLPKGIGTAIIESFQIPPSKRVAKIKEQLEADVVAGAVAANLSIDDYVHYLSANKERFGIP